MMRLQAMLGTTLIGVSSLLGCQSEPEGGTGITTFASQGEVGSDGLASEVGGTSDADSGSESESTGPKLDLPQGGSAEEGGSGCEKVDFLFVIDNSESMEDDQLRLLEAFPGFIQAIQDSIQAQDYHIGVITSDDHVYDYDTYYNGQPETECDVMGGLVNENWDYTDNVQRICGPFVSGGNYLTEDEPNLSEAFECIAFVDDEGSTDEAPMAAISEALRDPVMPCNEGFLRKDALLVIVLITDEDDDVEVMGNPGSGGTPQQWYDAVIAAKQGTVENAAVLALAGTPSCPYEHTVRIEEWVGLFGERGFFGPVCEDDYAGFFAESVSVVDEACDNFVDVP